MPLCRDIVEIDKVTKIEWGKDIEGILETSKRIFRVKSYSSGNQCGSKSTRLMNELDDASLNTNSCVLDYVTLIKVSMIV